MKRATYNWRKFLVLISVHLIETYLQPLTNCDNVLIVDDLSYDRNRSKAVELLARVKDHTTGAFFNSSSTVMGTFCALFLCRILIYQTFIPCGQSKNPTY
ncbi:hypothetical protein SAMN04488123_1172 [Natribacillus halophilus]|uniref:DDE superfamily endonuclease n=1 Tax=Natribacillus halophilus TaxID=549003 RepID=A0A1G8RBX2_9BACI|nr:hypothetical protein SAMN04488123_1172 [Natribacillus halophilus]